MRTCLVIGSLSCALAVLLGAFAAHGLKAVLDAHALETFRTGVDYQFKHSLALLLVGICGWQGKDSKSLTAAGWAFVSGIVLFCGSLYGLSLLNWVWLGPVTPLGGLSFILGWGLMAAHFLKMPRHPAP